MFNTLKSFLSKDTTETPQVIKDHYLYQYSTCPFCFRVSIAMKKLGIAIEQRNIHQNDEFRRELKQGGGSSMVPCLRIESGTETKWLYESSDIIHYLESNFTSK